MLSLVLFHAALCLLVAGLRFGPELDLVLGPLASGWATLTAVLAGLAALALRRELRRGEIPWNDFDTVAAWLILVAGPALLWAVADREITSGIDALVLGAMLALGVVLLFRHRGEWTAARVWFATGGRAGRALLIGTVSALLLIAFAIAAVRAESALPEPSQWVFALSTYPLYAAVQLGAALVLPVMVWRRRGHSERAVVTACAVLFLLIHAPNPVALTLTGIGMIGWAWAHLRGVGFVWLALSMGLLGAVVAQGLPQTRTAHMRVGATYVLKRMNDRAIEAYDARVAALASDEFFAASGGTLRDWLRALHVEIVGLFFTGLYLVLSQRRVLPRYRNAIALRFLDSDEFHRRHGIDRYLTGTDRRMFFSTFERWHPAHERLDAVWADDPAAPLAHDWRTHMTRTYEALLDRTPSAPEVDGWPRWPRADDRTDVVRVVLFNAGIDDPAEWRQPDDWPVWPVWPVE